MQIIFTSTIRPKYFNELSRLLLSESLELFEPREGIRFVPEEINPCFLAIIINKGQKTKTTSYGLGLHGSTVIYELTQDIIWLEMWKWGSCPFDVYR